MASRRSSASLYPKFLWEKLICCRCRDRRIKVSKQYSSHEHLMLSNGKPHSHHDKPPLPQNKRQSLQRMFRTPQQLLAQMPLVVIARHGRGRMYRQRSLRSDGIIGCDLMLLLGIVLGEHGSHSPNCGGGRCFCAAVVSAGETGCLVESVHPLFVSTIHLATEILCLIFETHLPHDARGSVGPAAAFECEGHVSLF